MNIGILLGVSFIILFLAYLFYGRYLAKKWGVDLTKNAHATPAHELYDGVDYCPATTPVLMGYHFSSIAGAGPITGPILAAFFGWVPVALWVLIGGIFIGGVHDFGTLFASVRNRGNSIASVIGTSVGSKAKQKFLIFSYFALLLAMAAMLSIVAETFAAEFAETGEVIFSASTIANSITATISLWYMVVAIAFGVLVYRCKLPVLFTTVIALVALAALMYFSFSHHPLYYSNSTWTFLLALYITIASVTPVWILLQPRDYLASYLLYAMMVIAIITIFWVHPTVTMPAFTGFKESSLGLGHLFPFLFTTVACGAVSGFHSLVSSGTTSKQLNREGDSLLIGYGGMLIESLLAIVSLCAVAFIWCEVSTKVSQGEGMNPTLTFAHGLSSLTQSLFANSYSVKDPLHTFFVLSISVFCLTTLDTGTRIARYVFQELWIEKDETLQNLTGYKKLLTNKYFATLITVALIVLLAQTSYIHIWSIFGATNQLLAALALLAVSSWLAHTGKTNLTTLIPTIFMLIVALIALAETVAKNYTLMMTGDIWSGIRFVIALILIFQALNFVIDVAKTRIALMSKK